MIGKKYIRNYGKNTNEITLHAQSQDDVESAFAWYEKQRRGLGFEFLDCVKIAVKSILENPEIYRIYYSLFRGFVIRRFPFSVFYTIEDKEIVGMQFLTTGKILSKSHNTFEYDATIFKNMSKNRTSSSYV